MRIHPYAELFPPIDEVALRKLAEDIAKNGLLQPIWTLDGQILDGRNRWNACKLAKVECRAVEYTGPDPLSFVISLNLQRRQLTASQLAMVGVELEVIRAKEAKELKVEKCKARASERPRDASGRLGPRVSQVPPNLGGSGHFTESARRVAKEVGVSHSYVSNAKRISRCAPDLVPLIKTGALNLRDANALVKMPEPQRIMLVGNLATIQKNLSSTAELGTGSPAPIGIRDVGYWNETEILVYLRRCFGKVLRSYVAHANGDFGFLIECVNDLLSEVRLQQTHSRRESPVNASHIE